MKPRVFFGSSVEGLAVAYAMQTNLVHTAETTIWSQGVFDLSKTTIESLFDILNRTDFGVFVFSPDDIVKMREKSSLAVRDNVMFEFGLFLGKLGRERVFFVIPSDADLHLPTDLLGITPAKYESSREDNNLIAATGAACYQISTVIKKIGSLQPIEENSEMEEINERKTAESQPWLKDVLDGNYLDAIAKIENKLKGKIDNTEKLHFEVLIIWLNYKVSQKNLTILDSFLNENSENIDIYISIADIYIVEDYVEKAIEILEKAKDKFGDSIQIIKLLASCHLKNQNHDLALECFQNDLTYSDPETSIDFADIHLNNKNFEVARKIIHKAYLAFPNNKLLLKKYGSIAEELNLNKVKLFLYDKLSGEEPDNVSYLVFLGNACLELDLYDKALTNYQKANDLEERSAAWILSNIGNLFKNKGLYSESIKYLTEALKVDNLSEYALNRLSTALKQRDEEYNDYQKIVNEGKGHLVKYSKSLLSDTSSDS